MKRLLLFTVATLLAVSILAGCGVSQGDYDKVFSDLTVAQIRIQSLESDLATSQDELQETKAAYEELQAKYDDLNSLMEDRASKLKSANLYRQVIAELITPAITGDALADPTTIKNVRTIVDGAEDEILKEKFDAWSKAPADKGLAADLVVYALQKLEELVF